MANNNYPQITSVTSEALQAQIRNLLPSQEGFGTDLMAQNVIVPIIDLTSAAEGSNVPEYLQRSLAFGSQTEFDAINTTTVVANTAGFYRIVGTATIHTSGSTARNSRIEMTDGTTTKIVWMLKTLAISTSNMFSESFDLNIFLKSGESISVAATPTEHISGSIRQVADVNGVLVNPSGFSPQ